jgi:hypothetical protein
MDRSEENRFVITEAQVKMALFHPFGASHRGTRVPSLEYVHGKYLSRKPDGSLGAFITQFLSLGMG